VTDGFPPGFFDRIDPTPDGAFYASPRFVTHIDDDAIRAVGDLYLELGLDDGRVLDLCSSWISHFVVAPPELVGVGLNAAELEANPQLTDHLVRDLNEDPTLPYRDASFDGAVCCVSVDYLVRPLEVFAEVRRVLRPGAPFACTFSNRMFATKAIRGWLAARTDGERAEVVRAYFARTPGFGAPVSDLRTPLTHPGDPLWAVWAHAV
jgi:SAM-dependent methyltransferase